MAKKMMILGASALQVPAIKKAKEILKGVLESTSVARKAPEDNQEVESYTIDDYMSVEIKDRIRAIDINSLTPIEALNIIWELKQALG